MTQKKILITGGAGFIGSTLVKYIIKNTSDEVLVVDKLTYAGNFDSLKSVSSNKRFRFLKSDIQDREALQKAFSDFRPDTVMHLAAESHVDRSIDGPANFIATNIVGTYILLEESLSYWRMRDSFEGFRFQHISTDEVYGSLGQNGKFTEDTKYDPSSPYSASKASSDHLVRAWHRTYGLPVLITNCSNNYGPFHYPEKLIPLMIRNAIKGKQLPVYGDGKQIRDWLYVEDHAEALYMVLLKGRIGETYNVGGDSELENIKVVTLICEYLDELQKKETSYKDQITFVKDRPGHDRRYAIDCSKIKTEIGWQARTKFSDGLRRVVEWYIANPGWVESSLGKNYDGQRLGVR